MVETILVTGGLGYIGSHTSVQLLLSGYRVIIIDNLCNSKFEVHERIKKLGGEYIEVYIGDLLNIELLRKIFRNYEIGMVMHFAGLKYEEESQQYPLMYFNNNLIGTLNLLQVMEECNVKRLVFSSSADVYGLETQSPIDEKEVGKNISSPYGKSKYMIEEILKDLQDWSIVILRYFCVVGCHPTGLLGEDPKSSSSNTFSYILRASRTGLETISIYGFDYPTRDGTIIRDFVHIEDVVEANLCSLNKLNDKGVWIYNVGTGKGVSVLELINLYMRVNRVKLYTNFIDQKSDIPILYANTDKIEAELGWKSKRNLEDICKDGYEYILNVNKSIDYSSEEDDDMDISDFSDFSEFSDND